MTTIQECNQEKLILDTLTLACQQITYARFQEWQPGIPFHMYELILRGSLFSLMAEYIPGGGTHTFTGKFKDKSNQREQFEWTFRHQDMIFDLNGKTTPEQVRDRISHALLQLEHDNPAIVFSEKRRDGHGFDTWRTNKMKPGWLIHELEEILSVYQQQALSQTSQIAAGASLKPRRM